jgi:hypothetical protein
VITTPTVRFRPDDFALPGPGYHEAEVAAVRQSRSQGGNDVVQVTFRLVGGPPSCDRLSDYFVIAGSSLQAVSVSRRRLVSLCRACGLFPGHDSEVRLNELVGLPLGVHIVHEPYDGQPRARITGYRQAS